MLMSSLCKCQKLEGGTYWTILGTKANLPSERGSSLGATEADDQHWNPKRLAGPVPLRGCPGHGTRRQEGRTALCGHVRVAQS